MIFKKKVTVHQMIEGMIYTGNKVGNSFFEEMISETVDLPEKLKNDYEWEIYFFCHAVIYLVIELSSNISKRNELLENYLIIYKDFFNEEVSEDSKNYLCQGLQLRFKAYKIAWDNKQIFGLYNLLSALLFTVENNSDTDKFINGYIQHSNSTEEYIKEYYTIPWFPSAHRLVKVTEKIDLLTETIKSSLNHFKII